MAGAGASSAWGPSPALVTAQVALVGLGLAAYIVGPLLYWHAAEALTAARACPACDCNCDARPLLDLPEGDVEAAGGKNKVIYEDVSMERGAFLVQQAMRAFRAKNIESAKSRLTIRRHQGGVEIIRR